jgi:hypothetical protein
MAAEARAKRFTDEVLGKSAASGTPWLGEPEQHVAIWSTLANTVGEDSDTFRAYVDPARARRAAPHLGPVLRASAPARSRPVGGDAMARINALASARASEKGIGFSEAMAQIEREQPALMAEYRESPRTRHLASRPTAPGRRHMATETGTGRAAT